VKNCLVADLVWRPQIPQPDSQANLASPKELASKMTQPLDSATLSIPVHKNFLICEAYSCNNRAVQQVIVSVGNLGNIELNVCSRCISKFDGSIVVITDILNVILMV
jgi:hypothetical protein